MPRRKKAWRARHHAESVAPGFARRELIACAALALTVMLVLGRVCANKFVAYDDDTYIYQDPLVREGLNLQTATAVFEFPGYYGHWHPLTMLSHLVDVSIWGLESAAGHHLSSLFIHALNTLLFYWLLRRGTARKWEPLIAAAVFAMHPLHVEPVAWAAARKDLLCGLFFLISLHAYVSYVRRPRSATYLLALLAYAAGLMSKTMIVTMPALLFLLDFWPLQRIAGSRWRDLKWLLLEKAPFAVLSVLFAITAVVAENAVSGFVHDQHITIQDRWAAALLAIGTYVAQFLWPFSLTVYYPNPFNDAASAAPLHQYVLAGLALLLTLGISAAVMRWRRRFPFAFVGWLWFLVMIVPVSGIAQPLAFLTGDRYMYLPIIGLLLLVSWGVSAWLSAHPAGNVIAGTGAGAVLLACALVSWAQAGHWRDTESLFRRSLAVKPNPVAYLAVANALADRGAHVEAIDLYEQALELNPHSADVHNNLGNVLETVGRTGDATEHYERAIALDPDHFNAPYNLGGLYRDLGQPENAREVFTALIDRNPLGWPDAASRADQQRWAEVHASLGLVLSQLGQSEEAQRVLARAIEIDPASATAHHALALHLSRTGEATAALGHYEHALTLSPDCAPCYFNQGNLLRSMGRHAEAIAAYTKAIAQHGDYVQAHLNMAIALAELGRPEAALDAFERAAVLAPDNADVMLNLGAAHERNGDIDAARTAYARALALVPEHPAAREAVDRLGGDLDPHE